ncbi:PREDICTED: uncharacterized protein LOC104717221 [Camelina sativa]|uniref:Uncharacterized protein LOC104717221 n=1 Tax=Camelina sativa TaxID=90675 RepID=A0ABM0TXZ8_CAMSA|nr:PREDICTED: uncharacterized protein LOC104717221 [Camelina sativa]
MDEFLQTLSSSTGVCHPDCVRASNAQDDYDASQSAALIAVSLISSARVISKLDAEITEYSAQYLVDNVGKEEVEGEMDQESCQYTPENILRYLVENVWTKKEDRQEEVVQQRRDLTELTVKECLESAFKKGLPRREHWAHLGCVSKVPPFACQIPRVPMKGEVIEATNWDEALELAMQQPVGARLHVFSPEFDLRLGEKGIYDGPSGKGTRYVGLRDVIIVEAARIKGKDVATVQICYKKQTSFVKVAVKSRSLRLGGDKSQVIKRTSLLVDFCMPRFSIN